MCEMSIEESWSFFETKLKENIANHVPVKMSKRKKPPWFNQEIKELIKREKMLLKDTPQTKQLTDTKYIEILETWLKRKSKKQ